MAEAGSSLAEPLSRPGTAPGEAPRAFVTGWPIAHSRSPLIHGSWLQDLGLAGSYERVAVAPEDFADFLISLKDGAWVGGNVTIPHKETAFALVERRDGAAEAIGAVNTLWFERGQLVGGNTDAYGFAANLDARLSGWRDAGTALVLGAGGAARAVVEALRGAGIAEIAVLNRTKARAEAIAGAFAGRGVRITAHGEDEAAGLLARTDLLVNTRPSAKAGGAASDLAPSLDALAAGALVTDIVYVPLETPILTAARARGHRTADGLGMLLHQAVPGFERWFGRRPTVDETLRQRILDDIAAG